MARERNMTVAEVVAYPQKTGEQMISWLECEARAKNLRIAALKGGLKFSEKAEPVKLQVEPHDSPRLVSRVIR